MPTINARISLVRSPICNSILELCRLLPHQPTLLVLMNTHGTLLPGNAQLVIISVGPLVPPLPAQLLPVLPLKSKVALHGVYRTVVVQLIWVVLDVPPLGVKRPVLLSVPPPISLVLPPRMLALH